jgi:glycosyltransferase involved in cell wall biosynthesis
MTPAAVSPAGVGRYPRGLLPALERLDGVEPVVLASSRAPARTTARRVLDGLVREGLWYPFGLAAQARRRGAALVHCPAPFAARVRDRPLVLTVHDLIALRRPELFSRTIALQIRLARRHMRRADRILTGSEHTRNELVELVGIPPSRVDVTPYGVEERFRPLDRDPGWLRERFGIGSRYVLCVGTLEPRKNLVGAVRAFSRAAESVEDCVLVVAGGRGWRNEAFERELAGAPGRVVLTGFVSDEELVGLYSGADCFLFPSLAEGFGFPVLEAMACGAPVVSSDRTSLPEVVGDAGLLVDPEDEAAVAAALERVLTEPGLGERLREQGLERAARYSWDACAEATVAEYRRLLG